MIFKNLCILVLWTKVASALKGVKFVSDVCSLLAPLFYIYIMKVTLLDISLRGLEKKCLFPVTVRKK